MAFIQGNPDDELQGQGQEGQAGQGQTPLVGAGSQQVGQGVSQGGVGAGGAGGWTNIQAYLKANEGDTGSSQALSKEVGSQFGKERDAIKQQSGAFVTDAEKQVNDSKVTTGQAGDMIEQGATDYDFGGQQKSSYTDGVNKIQGFLGNDYKGPKEYSYGFGADTQNYGEALKGGSGFDTLMNNVYKNQAGRPLSSGQFQLQKQFDVNNENLTNARGKLAGQFDQLGKDRDQTVTDTTAKLGGFEQDYRTTQNSLKDFLGRQSNDYDTQIGQAEADARAGYKQTFEKDHSGRGNTFSGKFGNNYILNRGAADLGASGVWGDRNGTDLTWQELQREQGLGSPTSKDWYYNILKGDAPLTGNYGGSRAALRDSFAGNASTLNKFYGEQDAKYGDTADKQERAYNTIQDFLKSDAKRKAQGFKVRG